MRSFYHAPRGFFPLLSPQRKRGYTSSSNTQRRARGTLRRPTKFARNCSRKHARALSWRTQSRRFLQQMRAPPGVRLRALSQTAGQLLLYRVGSHCRTQTRRLRIDAPGLRECLPKRMDSLRIWVPPNRKGRGLRLAASITARKQSFPTPQLRLRAETAYST